MDIIAKARMQRADDFHLVQRAQRRDLPHKSGVDAVLDWDYMGSSEYEDGGLARSLRSMRESGGAHVGSVDIGGRTVWVAARQGDVEDFAADLALWFGDGADSLDCSFFPQVLDGSLGEHRRQPDLWWALARVGFWSLSEQVVRDVADAVNGTTR